MLLGLSWWEWKQCKMSTIRGKMGEINRNDRNCRVNQRAIGWRGNLQCPSRGSGLRGTNAVF